MARLKFTNSKRFPNWRLLTAISLLLCTQLSAAWHTHEIDSNYNDDCKICSHHQYDQDTASTNTISTFIIPDKSITFKPDSTLAIRRTYKTKTRAPPIPNFPND